MWEMTVHRFFYYTKGREMAKRYYWLKLKDDFFTDKRIKKLRRIAGGDTYTIIYLKMMMKCMNNDGILEYEGIEDNFADELALDLDEDADNVQITVNFLMRAGLLEEMGENRFLMAEVPELIGSETSSAQRVRDHRERQKAGLIESGSQAKTNAQRQKMFRAKEKCKEKQHVPFIEDYVNNKRYGGNYYIVIKRDKYKCACCGSIENLCVHHIDGYDENKPENNNENKLITLCRKCHSNIHAGAKIDEDILESIDYYSNEMLPGNTDVTEVKQLCNVEKEIDKDKDKEIEKDKDTDTDKDKRKKEKIKHTYGVYKHVRLTDDDYKRLCDEYGDIKTGECITFLDEYIEMKPKYKANNHYLCIRKWVADAVEEHKQKHQNRANSSGYTSNNKVADQLNDFYSMINQWVSESEAKA